MRAWARAPRELSCGSCGELIATGAPVSYWMDWRRLRCVTCAGEAPPNLPDVAPMPAQEPRALGMTRISDAAPSRTRGALRTAAREWTPYSDPE